MPETVPVLLLPRLHQSKRPGDRELRPGSRARVRALEPAAGSAGAHAAVCLFRRRHAVVPQLQATPLAPRPLERISLVADGRRGHLRVRAGHAQPGEGEDAQRYRRDPRVAGGRKLQRRNPGNQRPGPPVARNLPRLRLAEPGRLPADQRRPDFRDDRRIGRELGRLHREGQTTRAGQHHHLPDGTAATTRSSRARSRSWAITSPIAGWGSNAAGSARRWMPCWPPATTFRAAMSWCGTSTRTTSSIATTCSAAATSWPRAFPRSGISRACITRTSTSSSNTFRRGRQRTADSPGGADEAPGAGSRGGAAAQRGADFGPTVPGEIRRRHLAGIRRSAAKPASGRLSLGRRGRNPPDASRPAAGRHAVARVFRRGTPGDPLHLRFPLLAPLPTGNP